MVTSQGETQVFDEITVTGIDDDQEVEVEAVFYAVSDLTTSPLTVDLAAGICDPANEIARQTITVTGAGPHKVGPFTIPGGFRGVTAFQDRVIGEGPQSWLDACGQPDETTIVYPPIEGSTQALDTAPAPAEVIPSDFAITESRGYSAVRSAYRTAQPRMSAVSMDNNSLDIARKCCISCWY